ncbi:MAG: HD domain-containing phosphohydrolase [Rickettsiales bacterium]
MTNHPLKKSNYFSWSMLLAWLGFVIAGWFAIDWFGEQERTRELSALETKLSLVAASDSRTVAGWVDHRRQTLKRLSDNVSLKLYMTELSMGSTVPQEALDGGIPPEAAAEMPAVEPAQLTFLRNLLISTAREGGFAAETTEAIPANMPVEKSPGILLLDANKKPVVSTQGMPSLEELPDAVRDFSNPKTDVFFGPFVLRNNQRAAVFRLPVYPVQASADDAQPLGYVVAAASLSQEFFSMLKDLATNEATAESLLISYGNDTLTYFSPRQDGVAYVARSTKEIPDSMELTALKTPHAMVSGVDYRGEKTFAVAENIPNTTWSVIRKIDQKVALADVTRRVQWMHIGYLLTAGLLTVLIIALWKHATALRAEKDAAAMRALNHTIERQQKLLDLIADTTPISTYILDREHRYRYANRKAAENAGMDVPAMIGKPIADVIGKVKAEPVEAGSEMAEKKHAPFSTLLKEEESGVVKTAIERQHIPLMDIPLVDEDREVPGVLVIESDITELVNSQERQQRTLEHLIKSLVTVVDKRDPHAAHHSSAVASLARGVAQAMKLSEAEIETVETAGQLMNLGKILIPENLLASGDLKDADRKKIRDSLMASADFLKDIEFDGPVVETIRQAQEKMDGSGPLGLKGDAILLPARIVSVCNSLVAMVSERAYRQKRPLDEALKSILEDTATYDMKVAAALAHFVENGDGKNILATTLKDKSAA